MAAEAGLEGARAEGKRLGRQLTFDEHRAALEKGGELATRRADQQVEWMWQMVRDRLMDRVLHDPATAERLPKLTAEVRDGGLTPTLAAQQILDVLG